MKADMLNRDLREKKQGCKNTAPKNFNHIFIEKPITNIILITTGEKAFG